MPEKNLLSGFSFFSAVDPDTLETIAAKCEILEFNAEDVIFHVDEPATHFYGLLEGEVDLVLVFKDKVLKTDIEYEEAIQATMVDEEKEIFFSAVVFAVFIDGGGICHSDCRRNHDDAGASAAAGSRKY